MRRFLLFYIFITFYFSNIIFAGTTGKIAGVVTDSQGEPLIGVNVLIKGALMGASTDIDGTYVILNVSPGIYELEFSYIGYQSVEVTSVRVSIDLTTTISTELQEEGLVSETITVIAERPLLTKDLTSSTAVVNSEQINALPVTEVSEILELQAGFVDGHVRGGRTGEVAYWIDGVPVTDAFDGGQVVEVNKDMVAELQFISGAFNAEYGQAMSGIVNITTKEPREKFAGNLTVYTGDFYSTSDLFMNLDNFDPSNIYNIDGGFSGVIIPSKLSYYVNARYVYFGGYHFGKRVFNPWNIAFDNDDDNPILHRDPVGDDPDGKGDGEYVAMNWNRRVYTQGKLIYNYNPLIKLTYSYIRDDAELQEYDRYYKFNPDGLQNRFRIGNSHLFKLTHMLGESSYYDLAGSFFDKEYKQYMFKDIADSRWVHPRVGGNLGSNNFSTGGMSNQWFERNTQTFLVKLDYTNQINNRHLLKTGLEFRNNSITFDDRQLQPDSDIDLNDDSPFMTVNPDADTLGTPFRSKYSHKPQEISFYIQDKIEFEDIVLNIGVRLDHFRPDGVILADPQDPDVYIPTKIENAVNFDELRLYTLEERKKFWYKKAKSKTEISPRLGASFPVTETGIVHFSYGHFFQIPNFEFLYRNPQFKLASEGNNLGIIGNADLKPQQTISGEIGLQQELGSDLSLDVSVFFRDIRDLVGTRAEEIALVSGKTYSKLVNSDFGFVKGLTLSLKDRFGLGLNYTVDYTFQIANGTASDPNQSQQALASGNVPEVHLIPLNWDQRHTLNATLNYSADNWGVSFIGNLGSGTPYTPLRTSNVSALRENSEKKPITWNLDMRLNKDFEIFGTRMTYFLRVLNVFDNLNETGVFDDTGRATYTTYLERDRSNNVNPIANTLEEWYDDESKYSEPRRIETGISFSF